MRACPGLDSGWGILGRPAHPTSASHRFRDGPLLLPPQADEAGQITGSAPSDAIRNRTVPAREGRVDVEDCGICDW
jgi:hypothetical protein